MEEGANIKANLIIALQTSNVSFFSKIVKTTTIPLYNIKDTQGCNLFHEIASSVIREETLIEIYDVLILEFNDRYFEESSHIIKSLLNAPKSPDNSTPLLDAVLYNRKVSII